MVSRLGLVLLASLAAAHPAGDKNPSINERMNLLKSYRLESRAEYTILNSAIPQMEAIKRDEVSDYLQIATLKLQETLPAATFRLLDDHYIGNNGVAHVHFKQTIDGIDVDNADFNVNILGDGVILSFGNSFINVTSTSELGRRDVAIVPPLQAFKTAVKLLRLPIEGSAEATADATADEHVISGVNGVVEDPTVKLAYVQKDDQLVLAWKIEADIGSNLLHVYVDAASGAEIAGVIDHTSSAIYEVYPFGLLNPSEGSRERLVDPEDLSTSPLGWLNDGQQTYTTTRGNNVNVLSNGVVVPGSSSLNFSFPFSPEMTDARSHLSASATQVFYTVNKFHDILYALGFDEAAGNFQVTHHRSGGVANDPIIVSVQDSSGAVGVISTPTDGSSPRMTLSVVRRDVAFDSTIVLHEAMHAVSARLVGGPRVGGCFSGNDGLSLTEGFSDFVPTLLRIKATDTRATEYTIAEWATATPLGLRSHYISTSEQTSPLYFATLNQLTGGGFDLATIWTIALYEIFWNLADTHGIGDVDSVTFDANGVPQGARYLLLKLILDSQALTPCRPQHLQARDALVQADEILTGGANRCAIWRGFAKRGFGTNAVRGTGSTSRVNGFAVPAGC